MKRYFVAVLAVFCLMIPLHSVPAQENEEVTANSAEQEKSGKDEKEASVKETAALEPMVVTATRTETPLSEVTKSVSVVDREDRAVREQYYIPELIDTLPGVIMERNGGPGQFTNISIRGAGAQYTQFQYNGMPLRDAADTQHTLQYFIGDLQSASNLDRIEVLKGTNSTLYGTQAMGGVINIIPERWREGLTVSLRNEMGEYNTFIENGRFAYGQEKYYIDLDPLYTTTDGVKNGGKYGYYYENLGFTAGAGVKLRDDMTLELSNIMYDSDLAMSEHNPSLDKNYQLVKNVADPNSHRESFLNQTGLNFNHQVCSMWDYSVKASYGETERHYFWSKISGDRSNYDGSTSYVEMQHNVHATEWLTLTMGMDYEGASYDGREPLDPGSGIYDPVDFDYDWGGYDLFGQAQFAFFDRSLFFTGGLRYNDHEEFDSKVVGEVSAAYIFKQTDTKIHSHFGTGYRTPSLYEIYGGYIFMGQLITVGNPDLEPEESTSYEFGISQYFLDKKIELGLTWFHIDFDDQIAYDGFANQYVNAKEAQTQGVEASFLTRPCKYFSFGAAYTYADSKYKNDPTDAWIRKEYLPRNKLSFILETYPLERLSMSAKITWQDEKIVPLYDPYWNKIRWEEDSVATVDLAATYKVLKDYKFFKDLDLFMKVENLMDENYSEGGYTMPGRWVYGGLKMVF
ncbi:TonB-dependent receptor plug domain-containing protein [Desulforhabdus amnigena]|uniref:TonB-dependent receptor n=1 Tax=Desulforhabdus amnigena TaxID=40218 RepID=A0A9W6CXT6_9BACT|nr:TonB-dependent receptor [Desulforhabdus amnigena]GLI34619.1 TonB-dependent receptor [Desulforhabdus amnigena]